MAHLIMPHDKGAVFGKTLHNLAQYKQLEDFVPIEMAREIADYPMELRDAYVKINGEFVPNGARTVIRTDCNEILVSAVGTDFYLENNMFLMEHIEDNFLKNFPDLKIESVGTLRNGGTFFLNLKVHEYKVTGDDSPTVSRLMFFNPLGQGSYKCGAHDVRIVCNNTLTAADAQARANGSLFKVRHMRGAVNKIPNALEQMANFRLGLQKHVEKLEVLARKAATSKLVEAFLDELYPIDTDSSELKIKRVQAARDSVMTIFNSDQALAGGTSYALLNAFTNHVDHREVQEKKSDEAYKIWNNLYGFWADKKEAALDYLLQAAV